MHVTKRVDQRILVFCGPDMTGKTEISKEMAKVCDIPYFKASSEHHTYLQGPDLFLMQLVYADTRMVDFLRQTGHSVVFDRAWPCEFAYSTVFSRDTSPDALRIVDGEMADMHARVVVCRRKSYAGIVDDIDPTTTQARLEQLDAAYEDFIEWTKCRTMSLYVDDEDLRREISDVLAWTGWL